MCIGAQFALTEATLVLATMVKAFEIERTNVQQVIRVGIGTTQPDHAPLLSLAAAALAPPVIASYCGC